MLPQEALKIVDASIVTIDAKPDMTAVWSPVVVEVKRTLKTSKPAKLSKAPSAAKTRLVEADFQVLKQGVTRVAVKMRMHAFLSFNCSFAIRRGLPG